MRKQWSKSKIDLAQLKIEIHNMSKDSKLYKLLRNELTKQNHWKQKPRGEPNLSFKKRRY